MRQERQALLERDEAEKMAGKHDFAATRQKCLIDGNTKTVAELAYHIAQAPARALAQRQQLRLIVNRELKGIGSKRKVAGKWDTTAKKLVNFSLEAGVHLGKASADL